MNYITTFGIRFVGPESVALQFLYNLYEESKLSEIGMNCDLFSFLDKQKLTNWKDLQKLNILHDPQFENDIYDFGEKDNYRLALNFKVNANFETKDTLKKLKNILEKPEFKSTFPKGRAASYTLFLNEYNVTEDTLYTETEILEATKNNHSFKPLSPCSCTYFRPSVRDLLKYCIYEATEIYSADWLIDLLSESASQNIPDYLGFYIDYEDREELLETISNHPDLKKKYTSLAKLMKDIDGGAEVLTKITKKNMATLENILCELPQ